MSLVRNVRELATVAIIFVLALAPIGARAQDENGQASCDPDQLQAVVTKGYYAARHADWQKLLIVALTLNFSSGVCKEHEQAFTAALYGDFFGAIGFRHTNMGKKADELLADGRSAARNAVDQGTMPRLAQKMLRRFDSLAAHPMDVPG